MQLSPSVHLLSYVVVVFAAVEFVIAVVVKAVVVAAGGNIIPFVSACTCRFAYVPVYRDKQKDNNKNLKSV